jgi:hypothetical protein
MLWILYAHWSLDLPDFAKITKSSSNRRKNMAIARLDGQKLTQVTVDPRNSSTQFDFDLGGVLNVRRLSPGYHGELWTLYNPDGFTLAVRGDGCYSYHGSTTSPEEFKWNKLGFMD